MYLCRRGSLVIHSDLEREREEDEEKKKITFQRDSIHKILSIDPEKDKRVLHYIFKEEIEGGLYVSF